MTFFRAPLVHAYLLIVSTAIVISGCKDNTQTPQPQNNPPVIAYFTESPGTVNQGASAKYTFKATDSDGTIDSLVLIVTDGSRRKWTPQLASYQDSASIQCSTAGQQTANLTAYDNQGGRASDTVKFTVKGNVPPVIKASPLLGVEGRGSAVALAAIESDADGDQLTTQVITVSPGFEARIDVDSLRYGMTDPNGNGAGAIRLQVSDGHNPAVSATIFIQIAAMDSISGRVHDILEGSYISTVNPSLVMPGPFAGYVKVDEVTVAVNGDGTFLLPRKIPGKPHAIEWFIQSLFNSLDSSFVARDTIPAGDNPSLDLGAHTNAGTGPTPSDPPLSLGLLRAYYDDMGLRYLWGSGASLPRGTLCGVNLKEKASQRTIYLSASDTNDVMGSGAVKGFSASMEDTIANRLESQICYFLPPQNRPNIVKGNPNDVLPVVMGVNNIGNPTLHPTDGYCIVFRQDNQIGLYIGNPASDGETKYCVVTLSYTPLGGPYPGGFEPAATLQECLSWLVAPGGGTINPALNFKTCMHESYRNPYSTGADQKDLTMFVLYTPGTQIAKLLNLP